MSFYCYSVLSLMPDFTKKQKQNKNKNKKTKKTSKQQNSYFL